MKASIIKCSELTKFLSHSVSKHISFKREYVEVSSLDSSLRPVLCTFDYQNGELEKWKKEKEEEATAHEKTRAERRQLRVRIQVIFYRLIYWIARLFSSVDRSHW